MYLKNFGKHRDARFEFSPGLNIIRGPNRSGKTWILRGISAALVNTGRFNSADAIKDEVRYADENGLAPFFSVDVQFADGLLVNRYRDASKNEYTINDTVYDKVGRGFFDPVGDATRIFPVALDGKAENAEVINIKLLSDNRFFLLGRSELDRSRILTRLVGMDVVEEAERGTRKEAHGLEKDLDAAEKAISAEDEVIAQYRGVPAATEIVLRAEKVLDDADALLNTSDTAERVLGEITTLTARREKYSHLVTLLDANIETLGSIVQRATQWLDNADNGEREWGRAVKTEEAHTQSKAQVTVLEIGVQVLTAIVARMVHLHEQIRTMEEAFQVQANAERSLKTAKDDVAKTQRQLVQGTEIYQKTMKELGICPLCEQSIGGDHKCA